MKQKQTFLSYAGVFLLIISLNAFGCNRDKRSSTYSEEPQPMLDTMFVVNSMKADPAFKEQLEWAQKFYYEHGYKLAWFKNHQVVPQADTMLAVVNQAYEEGLDPKKYKLRDFDKLFAELKTLKNDSAKRNALEKDIDIALSATYFTWASDYYRGIVIPKETKGVEWDVKRNKIKLHKALLTILGERESKYPYAEFKSLHPEYGRLKAALAKYRALEAKGGWPKVPAGTKVKNGQSSAGIPVLKKRLGLSDSSAVATPELITAIKSFQEEHGLKPDGDLGPGTLKVMNIPIRERIQQIIINMERWRWIPKSFEPDYLLVNIPEYTLHVYEDSMKKFDMKVIVGKTMNSTPIFSDKLEYVVLSPYWNVPMSIIKKELAPKLAGNPGYLERLDMEVVDYKGNPVSASSINWSSINEDNFKYVVRRRPGPKNDLGDVKFIFPNEDNVYLHDTPHDELFSQASRGFSHGCVRVAEPLKLAEYLLRDIPGYDMSRIKNVISQRKEKAVTLKEKLPVYLVYFTSWVDKDGRVHFREDLYGHDKVLETKYFNRV